MAAVVYWFACGLVDFRHKALGPGSIVPAPEGAAVEVPAAALFMLKAKNSIMTHALRLYFLIFVYFSQH